MIKNEGWQNTLSALKIYVGGNKEDRLSDHFNYGRLLRFTLPSIAMMVFTSIYSLRTGVFLTDCFGS